MGRSYGDGDSDSLASFFSLLQKKVLDTRRWDTREELRLAMVRWIETIYNRAAASAAWGSSPPVEF